MAIQRTASALLGLFSVVTLVAHQYTAKKGEVVRRAAWYDKEHPTFSDVLALVRKELWSQEATFCGSSAETETVKVPRAFIERLTEAVCYAASWLKSSSGLLHVSLHSHAFGFDLIGWLPSSSSGERPAVCLEVKSSGDGGFHLSGHQWSVAEEFHSKGVGEKYAVLVIRRPRTGGVPTAMDLPGNPVALVNAGLLRMDVDGYQIVYRTGGA